MTPLQKATAHAIVNLFETSRVRGDYAQVTLLRGDTGRLTYGRSQTTIASGNLYRLLDAYCDADGARLAGALRPYLPRVQARAVALDTDREFRALLRSAGADPVMRAVQDEFFDRVYWQPAAAQAAALGITEALGVAVVYDSTVHGSFARMRDRTTAAVGSVRQVGERRWIAAYVDVRRAWLAGHPNELLGKTVYRMDAFDRLIAAGEWDLSPPLSVRGVSITAELLGIDEDAPYALRLGDVRVGGCWLEAGTNYFPVRTLMTKLFGPARVTRSLGWNGTAPTWDEKPIPAAILSRDGASWGRVRDLAAWLGLALAVDPDARTITLTRAASE